MRILISFKEAKWTNINVVLILTESNIDEAYKMYAFLASTLVEYFFQWKFLRNIIFYVITKICNLFVTLTLSSYLLRNEESSGYT